LVFIATDFNIPVEVLVQAVDDNKSSKNKTAIISYTVTQVNGGPYDGFLVDDTVFDIIDNDKKNKDDDDDENAEPAEETNDVQPVIIESSILDLIDISIATDVAFSDSTIEWQVFIKNTSGQTLNDIFLEILFSSNDVEIVNVATTRGLATIDLIGIFRPRYRVYGKTSPRSQVITHPRITFTDTDLPAGETVLLLITTDVVQQPSTAWQKSTGGLLISDATLQ
jgi:hypothetical protein